MKKYKNNILDKFLRIASDHVRCALVERDLDTINDPDKTLDVGIVDSKVFIPITLLRSPSSRFLGNMIKIEDFQYRITYCDYQVFRSNKSGSLSGLEYLVKIIVFVLTTSFLCLIGFFGFYNVDFFSDILQFREVFDSMFWDNVEEAKSFLDIIDTSMWTMSYSGSSRHLAFHVGEGD
uniref:Uncharacterized protein n=1 Tax=Glossina pallidipes TaxID=7398 RepID=A0A1A9ZGH1_GLOPL